MLTNMQLQKLPRANPAQDEPPRATERVAETVLNTEDFKLNCNLVIIGKSPGSTFLFHSRASADATYCDHLKDFLVRHGYITPENCDGYLELVSGLRSGDLR